MAVLESSVSDERLEDRHSPADRLVLYRTVELLHRSPHQIAANKDPDL